MFDQSFSATNFRKLFDLANRKGVYLEGRFFPELEHITAEIKACTSEIRDLRRKKATVQEQGIYDEQMARLHARRTLLKQSKDEQLTKLLEEASAEVAKPAFSINIRQGPSSHGKPVYTAGHTAASYFALKQLQRNIRHLYKVKQANRHHILCQLRELLSDRFPKYVIRLDLSGFYESIPRNDLLAKLGKDYLLSVASKRLLTQLLWQYGSTYNAPRGLPRGVGLSAYLSELYMRSFDDALRNIPGVIYYARYVDDIVLVFASPPNRSHRALIYSVTRTILDYGLKRNRDKSQVFNVDGKTLYTLDFLGYSFTFGQGTIAVSLTRSKLAKYKERVARSFHLYHNSPRRSALEAQRLLVKRIRFLTSNTRLLNNKRNAMVGVFFSNSLLTTTGPLDALDAYLRAQAQALPAPLRQHINSMSFRRGFDTKLFYQHSVRELARIVKAWKYVT